MPRRLTRDPFTVTVEQIAACRSKEDFRKILPEVEGNPDLAEIWITCWGLYFSDPPPDDWA